MMKDHQIAKLVNDLRNIALRYAGTEQLRGHLSSAVVEAVEPVNCEVDRLRALAATCYAGLGAECNLPEAWLDALNAAAEGLPFTIEGLLPFKATPPKHVYHVVAESRGLTAVTRFDGIATLNGTVETLDCYNNLKAVVAAQMLTDPSPSALSIVSLSYLGASHA